MDQVKFVEDSLQKIWSDMVCLSDMVYHITSNFLKAVFHKFYMVHSWILCPIYNSPMNNHIIFLANTVYSITSLIFKSWIPVVRPKYILEKRL